MIYSGHNCNNEASDKECLNIVVGSDSKLIVNGKVSKLDASDFIIYLKKCMGRFGNRSMPPDSISDYVITFYSDSLQYIRITPHDGVNFTLPTVVTIIKDLLEAVDHD